MVFDRDPNQKSHSSERELEDLTDKTNDDAFSDRVGKQSRLISRVLTPALKIWLRSQLDQVEDLELAIEAGDRQLLSGALQQVTASAHKAVYKGLQFSQIRVTAHAIQTNLGQVLRGKPFRLLVPFPVRGTVVLSNADLNLSLHSPLLGNAVSNFLLSLLHDHKPDEASIGESTQSAELQQIHVTLKEGGLIFKALLVNGNQPSSLTIETELTIENGDRLQLNQFYCQQNVGGTELSLSHIPNHFTFELGSEVCLEELTIHPKQILCRGQIRVVPE
jgi:hypothetical protein